MSKKKNSYFKKGKKTFKKVSKPKPRKSSASLPLKKVNLKPQTKTTNTKVVENLAKKEVLRPEDESNKDQQTDSKIKDGNRNKDQDVQNRAGDSSRQILLRGFWTPLLLNTKTKVLSVIGSDTKIEKKEEQNNNQKAEQKEDDEEVLKKILNQINQEKEEFDSRVTSDDQKNSPKKSSLFDRIYTQDYKAKNKSTGFFGTIFQILNSNIVWQAVALASILGVVLFYFQSFQPLVLSKISEQVADRTLELKSRYDQQTADYFGLQNLLDTRFANNPLKLCTDTNLYNETAEDLDSINRLKIATFADTKLASVDDYLIFSDEEITNEYKSLYNFYSRIISKYEEEVGKLADLPRFLEFRNEWIITCQTIQTSNQNLTVINQACQNLITKYQEYQTEGLPFFWSQTSIDIEDGINLCNNLSESNFSQFSKLWLVNYDRIISFQVDFSNINNPLQADNQIFTTETNQAIARISEIEDERRGFLDMWYLLDFNL